MYNAIHPWRFPFRRLIVLVVACGITSAASAGAVSNSRALHSFVVAASSSRVDVVALGDSNQLFGGYGWDHGWTKALSNSFQLYATGLVSPGENDGNGAGTGYGSVGFSTLSTGAFQYTGAPVALDTLMDADVEMYPLNYLYLPQGQGAGGTLNVGMVLENWCPLNVNGNLRFHVAHGTFDTTGPGSFWLSARLGQPPWSDLAFGPVVASQTGSSGMAWYSMDLPAAIRNASIAFRPCPWGVNMTGPVLLYYFRVENTDRSVGASFHTLYARGGQSARDMAAGLLQASDAYLSAYFSAVRALQGPDKHVLIRVNTGLNDRNESLPSLGPSPVAQGDSAAAYADNLQAIINRIRGIWTLNAWDQSELYFLLSVSHPVSDPDDGKLVAYRQVAAALTHSNQRTGATDFTQITSEAEMLANNWYQAGGADRNHLTQPAFEILSARELQAVSAPPCDGDADGDGRVAFADVTTTLVNWGATGSIAGPGDANADGEVNFADITSALVNFGALCP